MFDQLRKLNYAVYLIERFVVVACLLVMAIVVFLDVVHRTFAGEANKFAEVGIKVAGLFGSLPAQGAPEYASAAEELSRWLSAASPYVLTITFIWLGYFGIRSAKLVKPIAPPLALAYATAGLVAVYGLIEVLVWAMPNGLIWSQPMALVLTLWVGFMGASMCTYERKHLKVEAVQRFVPIRYKPMLGFVANLATTVACLFLFWVSLRYVLYNYGEFVQTQGRGGTFKGWDVPRYQGFAVLPLAFAIMSARFLGRGVLSLQGKLEDPVPEGGAEKLQSEIETVAAKAVDNEQVDSRPFRDAAAPQEDA